MMVYDIMTKNPTIVVELGSHTDARDTEEHNELLSQRRAQSCVDWLVNQKGIDARRLAPKGYGEYVPRVLDKEMKVVYNKKTFTFRKGVRLTEDYINSLGSKDEQEAAHQLNRRTEMKILRDDYVPTGDSIAPITDATQIGVFKSKSIPVSIQGSLVMGKCFANNKTFDFELAGGTEVYMSFTEAMKFLKKLIITIDDFDSKAAAINEEDGTIFDGAVLTLHDFCMGDNLTQNVKVIVKKGQTVPFVIGEGFINEKFGRFTLDREKNVIIFEN